MSLAKQTTATVIPCLRYRDAPKAIDWLCRAFGFEKQLVVPDEQGGIAHAQLSFGHGMIMLGSASRHAGDAYGALVRTAAEVGGVSTQTVYAIVGDVDAHCARARAAGAEIVLPLEDKDYGGRDYTCRDLEGNVWSFGSYDPWAG
ncbi:MAG: VOC family protein [Deltaproteobacteria bacterium]|nr:VOC family protein [Deltaproteobacteria bacterium]